MPGFIYFLPNRNTASEAILKDCGLASIFGDGGVQWASCNGPDGINGCLCWTKESTRNVKDISSYFKYDKKLQVWRKCADGKYYVGYWDNNKPGPNDLVRSTGAIDGNWVTLADRQKWLIPTARTFVGDSSFPFKIDFDDEGKPIRGDVEDEYKEVCDAAAKIFDILLFSLAPEEDAIEPSNMTYEDLYLTSLKAIAINYQLGPAECGMLGLLNTNNAGKITEVSIPGALIDMPTWIDVSKKNDELDSGDDGETESTDEKTTSQPTGTSGTKSTAENANADQPLENKPESPAESE